MNAIKNFDSQEQCVSRNNITVKSMGQGPRPNLAA